MATEQRLIDANALKDRWTIPSPEPINTDAAEVLDSIDEQPTVDAVPVVRCKDCARCSAYTRDVFGNEYDTPRYHCLIGYGYNKPDHFCSYGERRTDNG